MSQQPTALRAVTLLVCSFLSAYIFVYAATLEPFSCFQQNEALVILAAPPAVLVTSLIFGGELISRVKLVGVRIATACVCVFNAWLCGYSMYAYLWDMRYYDLGCGLGR